MPLGCCQQENQDKFLLQLNRDDGWSVMGVFDGHGMWGGKVASIVRDAMLKALKDVDGRKMNGSDPEMVHLPSGLSRHITVGSADCLHTMSSVC